jgi:ATP-binding cassette subfamily B protein
MNADEILVLDAGHIIERGAHRTLLERGGLYSQMWALQQQENEISV